MRSDAVLALARCGKDFEDTNKKEILDIIYRLAQDTSYRVRLNAARALGLLPAHASISVLRSSKPLFATQDHPVIDKICRDIPEKLKTPITKTLQNKIEKLEKNLQNLQDKFESQQSSGESNE